MRKNRYQPLSEANPEQEQLPLDTICTILTRQSTLVQGLTNVFSAEVNPQDLLAVAMRLGFAEEHVRIVDADMGIRKCLAMTSACWIILQKATAKEQRVGQAVEI